MVVAEEESLYLRSGAEIMEAPANPRIIETVHPSSAKSHELSCFHCGLPCRDDSFNAHGRVFCCQGCLLVHDLLLQTGLTQFYSLQQHPGVAPAPRPGRWEYLDDPQIQKSLVDFTDGKTSRVTFHIPAIHCIACVWLLENLYKFNPAIGQSLVNFPARKVSILFSADKLRLSQLAALLASLGYEPRLTLRSLDTEKADPNRKRCWLQIGVAGFAFGNIMLFSLPGYMGLDTFSGPVFARVFGWLSLLLALPVVVFSAGDYWRSALRALRWRQLPLDVPIAIGIAALYAQSAFEIVALRGEGYLDSLAGLVFLLLIGRAFQQKTFEKLAFDRDYRCFFPLSATRLTSDGIESMAIARLQSGDRLLLRHGELLPADAILLSSEATLDYSFVTGESDPVTRTRGSSLYAGGKQVGATIEVELTRPVSQSYLASLWQHEAFRKERANPAATLTNQYSRRFTHIVLGIALLAAALWMALGQPERAIKAFTSVLIVACPCALALAAPFTLGTAQRLLARVGVFLKDPHVLERISRATTVVFDKTGTLTSPASSRAEFHPLTGCYELTPEEMLLVRALAVHSTHPHATSIAKSIAADAEPLPVEAFCEHTGCGLQGLVKGRLVQLGSAAWLGRGGVFIPKLELPAGSTVWVSIDGRARGVFLLNADLRPETCEVLRALHQNYEVFLLSGDNRRDHRRFQPLFGDEAKLHFEQSPFDKVAFLQALQQRGKDVVMVGDGLNDAGALKQSNVGVAVVENTAAFSPASDVIMRAQDLSRVPQLLRLSRSATRIVRFTFGVSAIYNLAGVAIAASGMLSPLICAILMPASSISVILFASGTTHWAFKRTGRNAWV